MQGLAGPTHEMNGGYHKMNGKLSLNERANITLGPAFYNQAENCIMSEAAKVLDCLMLKRFFLQGQLLQKVLMPIQIIDG